MPRRLPTPGSGPRCHDPRHRLTAPRARRGSPLAASHRWRPGASKAARDARDHAKIIPSAANAATKSRPRSSVRRLLPPPAHPLPKTPPHQIPIDGTPLTQPPRVPSLKAFRRRPSAPVDRPRRAGIRNPAQHRPNVAHQSTGSSAPKADFDPVTSRTLGRPTAAYRARLMPAPARRIRTRTSALTETPTTTPRFMCAKRER